MRGGVMETHRPVRKRIGPPARKRFTSYPLDPRAINSPYGLRCGEIDRLRRTLKNRRSEVAYVYWNDLATTKALVISNYPLDERADMVGCYSGRGLTCAQLREDLRESMQ